MDLLISLITSKHHIVPRETSDYYLSIKNKVLKTHWFTTTDPSSVSHKSLIFPDPHLVSLGQEIPKISRCFEDKTSGNSSTASTYFGKKVRDRFRNSIVKTEGALRKE